jgi:hypothetical protein
MAREPGPVFGRLGRDEMKDDGGHQAQAYGNCRPIAMVRPTSESDQQQRCHAGQFERIFDHAPQYAPQNSAVPVLLGCPMDAFRQAANGLALFVCITYKYPR